MIPPFDIFRKEKDGAVLWIGTASTMEDAERKVATAISLVPASYLIISLKTGNERVIEPDQKE